MFQLHDLRGEGKGFMNFVNRRRWRLYCGWLWCTAHRLWKDHLWQQGVKVGELFLREWRALRRQLQPQPMQQLRHFHRCSRGHQQDWRVQHGFSKHQMCLQVRILWCFRHGSSSSRHRFLLVTRGFKKCWRRLKHYVMIQLILRLLQQRKRSSARNSTRCWQLTWKVDVSTWWKLEWKLRLDSFYGDNFTKSFCHLRGREVWLWLRHCLPTLRFQRRKAVWNVCWRLSRWCNSLRSHPWATTQMSLRQQRWYGVVTQRWESTYNWLWLTALRMVILERQAKCGHRRQCWGAWRKDQLNKIQMDLYLWKSTESTWTKEKERIKESTKEEKVKEEIGLQLGLSTWQRSWTWLQRQRKRQRKAERKERQIKRKEQR